VAVICAATGRLASGLVDAIRCRGFTRGVAQLGSALRSGRRGRGFESRHPDSVNKALTRKTGQGLVLFRMRCAAYTFCIAALTADD
jgi:hypothetical protein